MKHQSLKKLTKREVLERSHADLAAARCAEETARFDLARRIAEVELSKRYGFMELVVSSVHAHLMFFRNGSETLGRLEGPINDALAIGEALRAREAARKVCGAGERRPRAGSVCMAGVAARLAVE
jgi:Arf-GAP/coiled-coil/ANK repeat/PH domain-containing protein